MWGGGRVYLSDLLLAQDKRYIIHLNHLRPPSQHQWEPTFYHRFHDQMPRNMREICPYINMHRNMRNMLHSPSLAILPFQSPSIPVPSILPRSSSLSSCPPLPSPPLNHLPPWLSSPIQLHSCPLSFSCSIPSKPHPSSYVPSSLPSSLAPTIWHHPPITAPASLQKLKAAPRSHSRAISRWVWE